MDEYNYAASAGGAALHQRSPMPTGGGAAGAAYALQRFKHGRSQSSPNAPAANSGSPAANPPTALGCSGPSGLKQASTRFQLKQNTPSKLFGRKEPPPVGASPFRAFHQTHGTNTNLGSTSLVVRARGTGHGHSMSGDAYGSAGGVGFMDHRGDGLPEGHAGEGGGGRTSQFPGSGGGFRAAVPRVVQDTATCIPLVKLFGRFAQSRSARPTYIIGRGLRHAVDECKKGVKKIKGAGKGLWEVAQVKVASGMDALADLRRDSQEPGAGDAQLGAVSASARFQVAGFDNGYPRELPTTPQPVQQPLPVQDQLRMVYIQIKGARGLVKTHAEGLQIGYSTYCVIVLGSIRQQTQVLKGSSAAPQWNEVFEFTVAQLIPTAIVQLEVWDKDPWGRDCFIGQASLDLDSLLVQPMPPPVDETLFLYQVDPRTGQQEPGFFGQLSATAWLGHRAVAPAPGGLSGGDGTGDGRRPSYTIKDAHQGFIEDILQDGFQVSSLLARGGLPKGLPLISHSSLGTLYEEPCVMFMKLSVGALRHINKQRLLEAALITNRTIRVTTLAGSSKSMAKAAPSESGWSSFAMVARAAASFKRRGSGQSNQGRSFKHQSSADTFSAAVQSAVEQYQGSRAAKGEVSRRVSSSGNLDTIDESGESKGKSGQKKGHAHGKRQQLKRQLQPGQKRAAADAGAKPGKDAGGGQAAGDAAPAPVSSFSTASALAVGAVALPFKGVLFAGKLAVKGAKLAATGGTMLVRGRGAPAGSPGNPDAAPDGYADGEDMQEEVIVAAEEEFVDNEYVDAVGGAEAINVSESGEMPESYLGSSEGGPTSHDGDGTYYYLRITLGSQTFQTRMRWMSLNNLNEVPINNCHFAFSVARPLLDVPVTLTLFVTPSNKRKGRQAARLTTTLSKLLEPNAPGTVTNLDGVPDGLILPFDDEEFGAAQLIAKVADADWRAVLFKVPLMSHELVASPRTTERPALPWDDAPLNTHRGDPVRHLARSPEMHDRLSSSGAAAPVKAGLPVASMDDFVSADPVVRAVMQANAASHQLISRLTNWMSCPSAGSSQQDKAKAQAMADTTGDPPSTFTGVKKLVGLINDGLKRAHSYWTTPNTGVNTKDDSMAGLPHRAQSPPKRYPGVAAGQAPDVSTKARPPIGEVRLRFSMLRPRNSNAFTPGSVYAIVRCGPHWARTVERDMSVMGNAGAQSGVLSQPGSFNWEVRLPLYDPSTLLSIAVVEVQNTMAHTIVGRAPDHIVIGKARMRLSSIDPFTATPNTWHKMQVFAVTTSSSGAAEGGPGPAGSPGNKPKSSGGPGKEGEEGQARSGSSGGEAGGAAADNQLICELNVQVRYPHMDLTNWKGALKLFDVYLAAAMPEPFYYLEIDDSDTWKVMQREAGKLVQHWLAGVLPVVPNNVSKVLVVDGRNSFSTSRAQHNWLRAKAAFSMFSELKAWFKRICSWNEPQKSTEVGACIFLLCYYPSTAFKLFFFMLALASYRQYLRRYGRTGKAADQGQIMHQGQDMEFEADVPANTTFQMLRQKYDRMREVALTGQNLFDDVASFLERLQAILTWQDKAASTWFMLVCVAAMLAIQLLGFSTVMFAGLLWQIRPPRLRDPIPPKPISYFQRLPCRSDELI